MIGKKFDTKALLSELENPVDLIEKLVKLFEENHVKE
jgi:hypothetical protein